MSNPAATLRDDLIAAALRVARRDGIAAASAESIIAEAGTTPEAFAGVFRSQDELMAELIQRAVNEEYRSIAPLLAGGASAADATLGELIEQGLLRYLASVQADPERERGMLELTQYALRDERIGHLARLQYARYTELVEMALDAAAGRTGRRWLVPVVEVARMIVALCDGITISLLVRGDDAEARALVRSAVRAVEAHAAAAGEGGA